MEEFNKMIGKRITLLCLAPILFLGGCLNLLSNDSPQTENEDGVKDRPSDFYESVLTYTGDGYFLPYGGKQKKPKINTKKK
ncbi:hypothetical protein ACPJHQ_07210 [Rossellomorea sp. H39__3]